MINPLKDLRSIRDLELKDKVLFLRLDLNVPMENGVITDDTRIRASLPTIKYAQEKGAKIICASHLGRPQSREDKSESLEPVGVRLAELLNAEVLLAEEADIDNIKPLLSGLKRNQIILLENLRYEPGEVENSQELAERLAAFSEVYVNDAFGACHRAHASIDALPRIMKQRGIGFLIEKEIQVFNRLIESPEKPFIAILGGSKVSDKIGVLERLVEFVDGIIIGGAMAYTFLKAQGHNVGASRVEADRLTYAKDLLKRMEVRGKHLLLPVDHVVADNFADLKGSLCSTPNIPDSKMALDIGPKTIEIFSSAIKGAKTIFWNGPMGVFEREAFSAGTFAIAKALAESGSFKIVGGGDSAAAAEQSGYADKMTHISTGGGASLEYLQGDRLPGLDAVRTRNR